MQLRLIETTRAVAPETSSILVTDIPAGDSRVGEKFRALWGEEFAAYTPVLEPKELSKLHAKRRAGARARDPPPPPPVCPAATHAHSEVLRWGGRGGLSEPRRGRRKPLTGRS